MLILCDADIPAYTSPEILKHGEFDEKSDVYSWALVLFCLVNRQIDPFIELKQLNNTDFINKVRVADIVLIVSRLCGRIIEGPYRKRVTLRLKL